MAKTSYNAGSPYVDTPQTSWYLFPITLREIPVNGNDKNIIVSAKHEFRPDLLSFELYNTPAYWWVFMVRNMDAIRDPIWDFKSGVSVWVPSKSYLQGLMGQ